MKLCFRKILLLLAFALPVSVLVGCEPADSSKDYGFAKIYIPQATVSGLDNTYPIPLGSFGQNSTYACYFEDGSLHIALGVVRAGYISDAAGFSVDLGLSDPETERKLAEYAEKDTPAMEMPSDICTVPGKITAEDGKNTGTCYVTFDMEALAARQSELVEDGRYRLLVLGLEISNPTRYELADTNTSVVIVLDLNSSHWDNIAENLPESEVRNLFPLL